jgi:hypothetical protein
MQADTLRRVRKAIEFATENDMRVCLADLHDATIEISAFQIKLEYYTVESYFAHDIQQLTVLAQCFDVACIIERKG